MHRSRAILICLTTVLHCSHSVSYSVPQSCPNVDPEHETVHLPHESDCGKFYKCLGGTKVLMECPLLTDGSQLHFNPELQVCDYPFRAGCENNPTSSPSTARITEKPTRSPRTVSPARPETTPPATDDIVEGCLDNMTHVYFPHESDCSLYYECDHGDLIRRKCPGGLYFDAMKQTCLWPWQVNCYYRDEKN